MSATPSTAGRPLSVLEDELLRIESQTWTRLGAKEQQILERTGLSPTRAYQLLNGLIAQPQAWEQYPTVMRVLEQRRVRYARSRRARVTTAR